MAVGTISGFALTDASKVLDFPIAADSGVKKECECA